MKIFAILILLFATLLPAQQLQTVDDYETAYPGLDFALHSVFIKCYVNHWKGTETSEIKGSQNKVKMECSGFWNRFVEESRDGSERVPHSFEILLPNNTQQIIPFPIWNEYLTAILTMSTDNPFRKYR